MVVGFKSLSYESIRLQLAVVFFYSSVSRDAPTTSFACQKITKKYLAFRIRVFFDVSNVSAACGNLTVIEGGLWKPRNFQSPKLGKVLCEKHLQE